MVQFFLSAMPFYIFGKNKDFIYHCQIFTNNFIVLDNYIALGTTYFFARIVIAQIFCDYIPLIMIVIIAFAILTAKLLVASKKKESKYWKWYALSLPLLLL
ncbi:MAG: hypothetical protein Q4D33_00615, partial [Prevotellaceae bacterium]|nr:hypothetical protein [Prevotellaceae bacterium]